MQVPQKDYHKIPKEKNKKKTYTVTPKMALKNPPISSKWMVLVSRLFGVFQPSVIQFPPLEMPDL